VNIITDTNSAESSQVLTNRNLTHHDPPPTIQRCWGLL